MSSICCFDGYIGRWGGFICDVLLSALYVLPSGVELERGEGYCTKKERQKDGKTERKANWRTSMRERTEKIVLKVCNFTTQYMQYMQ
jgi:hypothetical protein